MAVEEHRLARDEGDGSASEIDDLYDGEQYSTRDQRANNRTTYYESDVDKHVSNPKRAERLKRALKWQEGQYVTSDKGKSRGQQNHEEDKRRIVGILCSQLDVPKSQKRRVQKIINGEIPSYKFGHYSTEQVTLAVINVVVHKDDRWIEDEKQFREYMEYVGITNEDDNADLETMRRLRELVRERL